MLSEEHFDPCWRSWTEVAVPKFECCTMNSCICLKALLIDFLPFVKLNVPLLMHLPVIAEDVGAAVP